MTNSNVQNRTIFCHDNLEVLQGINSNSIDLIYLDPPFNKNKTFTASIGSSAEGASFRDRFREEDVKDEWLETIREDYYKLHNLLNAIKDIKLSNYCYLCYMAIRLIEMWRVLKDTGSIYLHCDPTMSHYLKILMDIIFGEDNFLNEIVWCYSKWTNRQKSFIKNHDIIFIYQKTKKSIFNPLYKKELNIDKIKDLKRGYHSHGKRLLIYNPESPLAKEKIKSNKYQDIVFIKEENKKGTRIPDYWDIPSLRSSEERTGYPTQKPLALLERIIQASSNEGDIVLDPFCGCATTCVASERLNRKWIGIDVSVDAYRIVGERLQKEVADSENLLQYQNEVSYHFIPPKRTDDRNNLQLKNEMGYN